MSKNIAKIRSGIKNFAAKDNEILSGVVTDINTSDLTITVLVTGFEQPISGVRLNAIEGDNNGYIIYPSVNSNVIIASIDGPGEYTLIRASDITKALITIGNQVFTMDGTKYGLVNGGESMGKILDDLFQQLLNLTVTTSTGPSGTPINSPALSNIKSRLDNFLII